MQQAEKSEPILNQNKGKETKLNKIYFYLA